MALTGTTYNTNSLHIYMYLGELLTIVMVSIMGSPCNPTCISLISHN